MDVVRQISRWEAKDFDGLLVDDHQPVLGSERQEIDSGPVIDFERPQSLGRLDIPDADNLFVDRLGGEVGAPRAKGKHRRRLVDGQSADGPQLLLRAQVPDFADTFRPLIVSHADNQAGRFRIDNSPSGFLVSIRELLGVGLGSGKRQPAGPRHLEFERLLRLKPIRHTGWINSHLPANRLFGGRFRRRGWIGLVFFFVGLGQVAGGGIGSQRSDRLGIVLGHGFWLFLSDRFENPGPGGVAIVHRLKQPLGSDETRIGIPANVGVFGLFANFEGTIERFDRSRFQFLGQLGIGNGKLLDRLPSLIERFALLVQLRSQRFQVPALQRLLEYLADFAGQLSLAIDQSDVIFLGGGDRSALPAGIPAGQNALFGVLLPPGIAAARHEQERIQHKEQNKHRGSHRPRTNGKPAHFQFSPRRSGWSPENNGRTRNGQGQKPV